MASFFGIAGRRYSYPLLVAAPFGADSRLGARQIFMAVGTDRGSRSSELITLMTADLEAVSNRVLEVTELSYPVASSVIREIVLAGGKRLRPMLVLLAGRPFAYEANFDELITAAAGVELLHVASLVHDDTIDRAALRRGKPTLNSVMSVGGTILVGDFLFAQSAMLAARTGDVRVVSVFAATLGDLCDGQLNELFDAHRLDQDIDTYMRRISGKTASLYSGAAEMGAILGRTDAPRSLIFGPLRTILDWPFRYRMMCWI